MAADGRAFGVALGFYCVIAVVVFIFFGFARMSNLCKKFYAPKRCAVLLLYPALRTNDVTLLVLEV